MKKHVVHYFATHKDSNECFSTSDGFLFHTEGNASAHAFTLKDSNVKGYKRDEYSKEIEAYKAELDKPAETPAPTPSAAVKDKSKEKGGNGKGKKAEEKKKDESSASSTDNEEEKEEESKDVDTSEEVK